jgi:hypothetical protein
MKRDAMSKEDKFWHQGFACCLATAIRMEGCWATEHKDLLNTVGLEKLREAGIQEFDAEVIFDPEWSRNKVAARERGER